MFILYAFSCSFFFALLLLGAADVHLDILVGGGVETVETKEDAYHINVAFP